LAVGSAYASVPDDALRVAQTYFEDHWKPIAEKDPSAFDVEGIDISAAALGSPFSEYILRDEKVTQYVISSDVDPRKYAVLSRYDFPILVHGECMGTIMVQRNRDENTGKKFDNSSGDFFFLGVSMRNNHVDKFLLKLRNQSPAGAEISWVQIVGVNVSPRFIVDVPGKPLLAGTYGAKPMEASLDVPKLKAEIQAKQKIQTRESED